MFQNVEAAKLTLCVRNMMPERLTRTPEIQDMFAKQNRKFPNVNLKRLKNSSQANTLQFVHKFVNI